MVMPRLWALPVLLETQEKLVMAVVVAEAHTLPILVVVVVVMVESPEVVEVAGALVVLLVLVVEAVTVVMAPCTCGAGEVAEVLWRLLGA